MRSNASPTGGDEVLNHEPPGNLPHAVRDARRRVAMLARIAAVREADDGISWWVIDPTWTELRERNGAAERLFGLTALSELPDLYSTFGASDRTLLADIADTGGTVPRHAIRRPDDEVRIVTTTALPLPSGEIGFVTVDVTDHERHHDELLEAVDRLTEERDELAASLAETSDRADRLAARVADLDAQLDVERRSSSTAGEALRRYEASLARIVHDLRAPLNTILGFTELIERDESDPERVRWLGHMNDAGHHLLETADLLLELVRAEGRQHEPQIVDVDLAAAVSDASSVIRHDTHRRGISLVMDVPSELVVAADQRGLAHVLTNLLSNAAAHTPDHGTVAVTAQARGQRVVVSVTDSGPGIPPGRLASVFEPFETDGPGGSGHNGAGLGLAICREYVESMNGSIGALNAEPHGATFWVELPAPRQGAPRPSVVVATTDDAFADLVDGALRDELDIHVVRTPRNLVRVAEWAAASAVIVAEDLGEPTEVANVLAQLRSRLGGTTPVAFVSEQGRPTPPGSSTHLTTPLRVRDLEELVHAAEGRR